MRTEYISSPKNGKNYKVAVQAYEYNKDPTLFYYKEKTGYYFITDKPTGLLITFTNKRKNLLNIYNEVSEKMKTIRNLPEYLNAVEMFKKYEIIK